MVFLEAALAGLPVLSYRHGGVPEAVQDGITGVLVREGDVHTLGDWLGVLVSDPALARRLGAAGRERVINKFDIVARTRELESVYDEVVAGRR
jgi:glycosyltransferase involved in cell wall biosynthesis